MKNILLFDNDLNELKSKQVELENNIKQLPGKNIPFGANDLPKII